MKSKNINEIKNKYKFTINQEKKIIEAKNWMLAKYGNLKVVSNIEMIKEKPQRVVILLSNEQ